MYRALVEYLRESENNRHSLLPLTIAFIFGCAGLSFFAPYVVAIAAPVGIVSLIGVSTFRQARINRNRAAAMRTELGKWIAVLKRFEREGQLESRSHSELIEELEACAVLREDILKTLKTREWKELAAAQGWEGVAGLCSEVAEDLLRDALWASKPLFRPVGARRSTFERRCQDASFGARPLAAVRLAKAQLERLLDDVSDFPLASLRSTDALARAQIELKALRDAEREIYGHGERDEVRSG